MGRPADEGLVTNFARTTARAAVLNRRLAVLALALLVTGSLFAVLAGAAAARVVTVGSTTVGLQGRVGEETLESPSPTTYANPAGNPVVHGASTYAVYWDPTDHYHGDWQAGIDEYLNLVGGASGTLANVFAVDGQYQDKTNTPAGYSDVFKGAYTDTTPYPASGCTDPNPMQPGDRIGPGKTSVCLTNDQVAAQLEAFVATHALPRGMHAIYYLLTPPGVTVCLDAGGAAGHCSDFAATTESYENSFCSYHGDVNPGGLPTGDGNTLLYGMIPWSAGGLADPHLLPADQTPGYDCQDGGFDPSSKPPGEEEHAKEKTKRELEEFAEATKKEKEEKEAAELLEGPHAQQPNQESCPTADGGCDEGLFDLITNQLANEHQNIVTDPLLNAWQDEHKNENTDECRFDFAPVLAGSVAAEPESFAGTLYNQQFGGGVYYLNDAFNLAALKLPYPGVPCITAPSLAPRFTSPNPVNSGELVTFDGMESNVTLNAATTYPGGVPSETYATYAWSFGDGGGATGYAPGAPICEAPWLSPCAASVFHSYTYGGTYTVTLTVTDVAGNVASVSHEVTVDGPAPPAAGGSAGPGGSTPGAAAPGAGGPLATIVPPVAKAVIASRSLRTALRHGLAVSYSVNEQVTGHFEVLISRKLAHRLRIRGKAAKGLPAGTAPQLVIAKAVLVTTKGGRSTVHIRFSKKIAARLKHAHHPPLMLRLVVRNAATSSPLTATVLSSVTLGR
jgi:PKD domain